MIVQILMLFLSAIYVQSYDDRHPWEVFLEFSDQDNSSLVSNAIVISKHLILTSAHVAASASKIEVFIGCHMSENNLIAISDRLFWDRTFNEDTQLIGIGVVLIAEGLKFNEDLQPIELATECPEKHEYVFYRDYGVCCQTKYLKTLVERTYEDEFSHFAFTISNNRIKCPHFIWSKFATNGVIDRNNRLVGMMTHEVNNELRIICVTELFEDIHDVNAVLLHLTNEQPSSQTLDMF